MTIPAGGGWGCPGLYHIYIYPKNIFLKMQGIIILSYVVTVGCFFFPLHCILDRMVSLAIVVQCRALKNA